MCFDALLSPISFIAIVAANFLLFVLILFIIIGSAVAVAFNTTIIITLVTAACIAGVSIIVVVLVPPSPFRARCFKIIISAITRLFLCQHSVEHLVEYLVEMSHAIHVALNKLFNRLLSLVQCTTSSSSGCSRLRDTPLRGQVREKQQRRQSTKIRTKSMVVTYDDGIANRGSSYGLR